MLILCKILTVLFNDIKLMWIITVILIEISKILLNGFKATSSYKVGCNFRKSPVKIVQRSLVGCFPLCLKNAVAGTLMVVLR